MINRPGQLVDRVATGEKDSKGNKKYEDVSTPVLCEIQQVQRGESDDDNEMSSTKFDAFFAHGTVITSTAALIVDGVKYEFVGDPWAVWDSFDEAVSHVQATLVRAGGS